MPHDKNIMDNIENNYQGVLFYREKFIVETIWPTEEMDLTNKVLHAATNGWLKQPLVHRKPPQTKVL